MDTSLGALRARLFNFRSWDSTGSTLDGRIREAMNAALDRISGDVPEAIVPDDEHIVLLKDATSDESGLYLQTTADNRVFMFVDSTGTPVSPATAAAYVNFAGVFDGIMHLEIVDANGDLHRRQSREFFTEQVQIGNLVFTRAFVSIDRPWPAALPLTAAKVRIHQPEFFVTDDVMKVLEPARIFDETRQQVWAIDTGGAARQDMLDLRGEDRARPYRFWRTRHFQLPAPTQAPVVGTVPGNNPPQWAGPEWRGKFRFCYTYVWGRKDQEWQDAPGGIRDPMWESAPSPASAVFDASTTAAVQITAANIDAMLDFGVTGTLRYGHSGMRIRVYVARDSVSSTVPYGSGFDRVEANGRFFLLGEFQPVAGSVAWDGSISPDYQRPLKHSTGYYGYSVFPHQDERYELDFRVQRLSRNLLNDQDTVPIQRDAVLAYLELCLHYMCLMDGVDQVGADRHLIRYNELARHLRKRYANPGGSVEPVPITGYQVRFRYGTYRNGT